MVSFNSGIIDYGEYMFYFLEIKQHYYELNKVVKELNIIQKQVDTLKEDIENFKTDYLCSKDSYYFILGKMQVMLDNGYLEKNNYQILRSKLDTIMRFKIK